MKKLTLIATLLGLSMGVWAQKADVKNDKVLSDGKAIAQIKRDGCKVLSPSCQFYISNLDGESLITIAALDMIDPLKVSSTNEDGKVRYLRLSFTGFDGVAEIQNPALLNTRSKDVVKSIVKAGLIKDGQLDEKAVANFINAHGVQFSDRQKEINSQVIIIREGQ